MPLTPLMDNKLVIWQLFQQHRYGRVLELGPLDGRDTQLLATCADEVVAIEGRSENIETVEGMKLPNVEVIQADLEHFALSSLGEFDCVWASGVLYHLPRPWLLVEQIAAVAPLCFGWTHLASEVADYRDGYAGCCFVEGSDRLAGMSSSSWWVIGCEFHRMWKESGFRNFFATYPAIHINGGFAAEFISVRM